MIITPTMDLYGGDSPYSIYTDIEIHTLKRKPRIVNPIRPITVLLTDVVDWASQFDRYISFANLEQYELLVKYRTILHTYKEHGVEYFKIHAKTLEEVQDVIKNIEGTLEANVLKVTHSHAMEATKRLKKHYDVKSAIIESKYSLIVITISGMVDKIVDIIDDNGSVTLYDDNVAKWYIPIRDDAQSIKYKLDCIRIFCDVGILLCVGSDVGNIVENVERILL